METPQSTETQAPDGLIHYGRPIHQNPLKDDCGGPLDKLFEAMALAQSEIQLAVKDSSNPHFKSSYAGLDSIWDTAHGPLNKNGISVMAFPKTQLDNGKGRLVLRTVIAHKSGAFLAEDLAVGVNDLSAQVIGSAITYARRYTIASICGVAPYDDDGNAASGRPSPAGDDRKAPQPAPGKSSIKPSSAADEMTEEQGVELADLFGKMDADRDQSGRICELVTGKKKQQLKFADAQSLVTHCKAWAAKGLTAQAVLDDLEPNAAKGGK